MLQLAGPYISQSLAKLFNNSPNTSFPANITPVHKKGDGQTITNNRPISLLSNISKVFKRLVFNHLYTYLISNDLLTPKNAGYKKKSSTVTQLLDICQKLYKGIDSQKEVRMVFLDASKAFDRVLHAGLLFKLKQLGICQPILGWVKSYLSNRFMRVVVKGQSSSWSSIEAGVPQGSILGPLLFLIYTNDVVRDIICDIFLYADDTSLLSIDSNSETAVNNLNHDLQSIQQWAERWFMLFNPSKTVSLTIYSKSQVEEILPLTFNNTPISEVDSHTHLGLTLSKNMSWKQHVDRIIKRVNQRLGMLQYFKYYLPRKCLSHLYHTTVLPIIDYCDLIYASCRTVEKHMLDRAHFKAARIVTGAMNSTNITRLLSAELGWNTLEQRRQYHKLVYFYKMLHGHVPPYLSTYLPRKTGDIEVYSLRKANNIKPYKCHCELYKTSYFPSSVILWNVLNATLQHCSSLNTFKVLYKNSFSLNPHPNILMKVIGIYLYYTQDLDYNTML